MSNTTENEVCRLLHAQHWWNDVPQDSRPKVRYYAVRHWSPDEGVTAADAVTAAWHFWRGIKTILILLPFATR